MDVFILELKSWQIHQNKNNHLPIFENTFDNQHLKNK